MFRALAFAVLAAFSAGLTTLPARADDVADFMARFSGKWIGTGQLLFGTDNGLEFVCELNGDPSASQLTFGMTGSCRMGSISAPIHAKLRYSAETKEFYGQFLGGAAGDGVDLIGTRAGKGFSLRLLRGATQGRLTAETRGQTEMKVVIYYRDTRNDRELPVVAMGFPRLQNAASR